MNPYNLNVNGNDYEVSESDYIKIMAILNIAPSFNEEFVYLPSINDTIEKYIDNDGNFDTNSEELKLLLDDYSYWDDETGSLDNQRPFRMWINEKYLIEWNVYKGEPQEINWVNFGYGANSSNIKLIEIK